MMISVNLCRRGFVKSASLALATLLCISLQAEDKKKPTEQPAAAPDFTGDWNFQTKESGFGFDLVQTGDKIEGYHNSVVGGGRRVDTVLKEFGSPPSITGTVVNGVASVKFKSGYGDGEGEAEMKIVKGKLEWKIKNSTGQHYFPEECVLTKQKPRAKKN
ncbi:hypothetical protein DES53_102539 [Roseimicrobium gellanilyticum]|uniref:Secreted protein n=1 Tax=Roseimicrobium gellanilyticum TaxID=748857 RepID=A0A366HTA5_9BACT|nr:hypothetical protein [Roseimicrobium gellanilyticum]RBP46153.1 hypothetical protein DES53_102539 [Roseimicrobium gellanilyticum]